MEGNKIIDGFIARSVKVKQPRKEEPAQLGSGLCELEDAVKGDEEQRKFIFVNAGRLRFTGKSAGQSDCRI